MDESGPQRSVIRIKQGLENMLVLARFFISWEDFAVVQIDKFGILVSLNGVEFLQLISSDIELLIVTFKY